MADRTTNIVEMRQRSGLRRINIRPVETADLLASLDGIVGVLRARGPHALTAAREVVGLACRSAGGEDDSAVASLLLTARTQPDLYTDAGRFRAEHAAFVMLDALIEIIREHGDQADPCGDDGPRLQAALAETCARLLLANVSGRTGIRCSADTPRPSAGGDT